MKILIVEDEKELAKSIAEFIDKDNYSVDYALNFSTAEEKINLNIYDCTLIDIILPDGSGLELVKLLKKIQPKCGVIIITAKDTLDDKIAGFELGADDYLTKPFHLAELNARLKSVIRRRSFDGSKEIIFDDLILDPDKRTLKIKNENIELTRREFDILLFFSSNRDKVLTKETIIQYIWGEDSNSFGNLDFVYTHIKNLRKKLADKTGKDYIQSVYGIGYKFIT
jgi:DNA-binding response OmpR family regulator